MKIYFKFVAFCALQKWGTTAFTVPQPLSAGSSALQATPTPSFGSVGGGWDVAGNSPVKRIEGKTRRTWIFDDVSREVVQVTMNSEGRPMNADVELWIGPDWTPLSIKAYSEDGRLRPIQTLVGTRNKEAQVEIRNIGPYEFPLSAACSYAQPPLSEIRDQIPEKNEARYVEGGAVYSFPVPSDVDQVQVLLNTDTRQLNSKVELLNGPNNVKQNFEVFTNNGMLNSLYVVFNTPGGGNTVRVTNIAPLEFPCKAFIIQA